MKRFLTRFILLFLLAALASGCSWSKKDKEPEQKVLTDYRESSERSPLEIPPDLSSESVSKTMSVPRYQRPEATQQAPQVATQPAAAVPAGSSTQTAGDVPKMYIERAGSQRWLVVYQSASETWTEVRDYILASGLVLERDDKDAGILETGWADNYAKDVLRGSQKYLGKWIGSLYTTGSRDKFRIRVEPGRLAGTSEVYLSHRGMIEKAVIDNNVDPVRTVWEPIPPDANIEAEMLALLMVEMGASQAEASTSIATADKAADRASIVDGNGQPSLIVFDTIDIAWRRVGQTLDRVGFSVEDRDISKREYFVLYADPELNNKKPGFFSKMFKKDKDTIEDDIYRISLIEDSQQTRVEVTAKDGSAAPEKVTTQIVKLLHEQLK